MHVCAYQVQEVNDAPTCVHYLKELPPHINPFLVSATSIYEETLLLFAFPSLYNLVNRKDRRRGLCTSAVRKARQLNHSSYSCIANISNYKLFIAAFNCTRTRLQ